MIWIAAALLTASATLARLAVRKGMSAGYALREMSDLPDETLMRRVTACVSAKFLIIAHGLAAITVVAAVLGGWIVGRFL